MICKDSHGGRSQRPHTHFDAFGLPVRPVTFQDWWEWGIAQAEAAYNEKPSKLHQDDYPPEEHPGRWRVARRHQDAVAPPPFTRRFQNYLYGREPKSPLRRALFALGTTSRGRAMERESHEFRILFALSEGHTDPETVRAIIGGCRQDFFETAAIQALRRLWAVAMMSLTPVPPSAYTSVPTKDSDATPVTAPASGTRDFRTSTIPNPEPALCDCHVADHGRPPKRVA